MRLLLLFSLLVMAALAANQVQGPDGMPGHKAVLQRQDSDSLLYETETVLFVDFIPALSTSTVYQTTQITITGCLPSVSSCPDVSTTFTTATTAVYTTLCPVTLTSMRVGRMTVPMATSTSSRSGSSIPTVSSLVGTAPGSSNTQGTNVAYTATATSSRPLASSTAFSTPSFFIGPSGWPATIFSTHSSTILLGASSEASVYPTASTFLSSFNGSSSLFGPILTSFRISSTPLVSPSASATASLSNGSVVINSSIITTFAELSTSFEVLTTLACNSTCYSSIANSTRSVSFRMPLPIGLSTRAVATYWNATTSTTGGSLVVPNSPSPLNGTAVTVLPGAAVPTPVNATAALTTGSVPSGVLGSTAVVPGNGATNSTRPNNSSTIFSSEASPVPLTATTFSADFGSTNTSQSAVLASSTLASASSSGNISSIALTPTVQPFESGAESETTSSLVFGLVALVYLVILVKF